MLLKDICYNKWTSFLLVLGHTYCSFTFSLTVGNVKFTPTTDAKYHGYFRSRIKLIKTYHFKLQSHTAPE